MSDLLTSEERAALQEAYATHGREADIHPASFPSVSQLDAERTAALTAAVKRWIDLVLKELSRQLRLPCASHLPSNHPIARSGLPLAEEASFWGQIADEPEHSLLVSLPCAFAAAICERILGAPFAVKEERKLYPSEIALLRELSRSWLELLSQTWGGLTVCPAAGPGGDRRATTGEQGKSRSDLVRCPFATPWLRFTGEIVCGGTEETPPVRSEISLTMDVSTARRLLGETRVEAENGLSLDEVQCRLGDVPLELRALLGKAEITVDRLGGLRIGDVITLDRNAREPVDLMMDGRLFLQARAGLSGGRIALEVL